jgi:hypothetical protein
VRPGPFGRECGGHRRCTGAHEDDAGRAGGELGFAAAHLRGPLAAEQSTEVAQEHEHQRTAAQEVAHADRSAGGIMEDVVGQLHRAASAAGKVAVQGSAPVPGWSC